jgi:hypothetical protein
MSTASSASSSSDRGGIDPRGPRVVAGITAVILLVIIALALLGLTTPAAILLGAQAVVFLIAAVRGVQKHPYGYLYKAFVRPRLKPPVELEDPAPPTFAQGVGLLVIGIGLVLHLLGVPYALVIAAAAAFVAAFLNSVFAYCLGCQIYLLLARIGIIRRKPAAA